MKETLLLQGLFDFGVTVRQFLHTLRTLRYNFAAPRTHPLQSGDVSELADEHDLGSCAARREGSIPSVPTKSLRCNRVERSAKKRIEGNHDIENR